MNDTCPAFAADHRTAREQIVPRFFGNRIRFSGEEGFVDFQCAVHDNCIRTNLHAAFQKQNVIQFHLCQIDFHRRAVSLHHCFWSGQQRQLFNQTLCFQLLHNPDGGIQSDHKNEKQIRPGVHKNQRQGNQHIE